MKHSPHDEEEEDEDLDDGDEWNIANCMNDIKLTVSRWKHKAPKDDRRLIADMLQQQPSRF